MSRNPVSMSEIAVKYIHVRASHMLRRDAESLNGRVKDLEEMQSMLEKISNMAYDDNACRFPMGIGMLLAMIFLLLYGLIYFLAS